MGSEPMTTSMQATASRPLVKPRCADRLLRHCFAFDEAGKRRVPARTRLEEALGPELARRLVTSLTGADRR